VKDKAAIVLAVYIRRYILWEEGILFSSPSYCDSTFWDPSRHEM